MNKEPAPLTPDDLEDIITARDVAKMFRIDRKTVYDAIRAGQLKAFLPAGKKRLGYHVHKADAQAWFFNDQRAARK